MTDTSQVAEAGMMSEERRGVVLEALGEASVCWHVDGVFDADSAIRIANRLCSQIEGWLNEAGAAGEADR